MSTLIDCPACERKLRVPDDFLGKSVRCPSCGETFPLPAPASSAPAAANGASPGGPAPLLDVAVKLELDGPAPSAETPPPAQKPPPAPKRVPEPEDDDRDEPRRPRSRRRRDFDPCPGCGEDVRRGAVVCPHCGLDLEVQGDGYTRQPRLRRDAEPHRGGLVQGLGIASLVLAAFYIFPLGIPLGIAAWVMGRGDLRKIDSGAMDPAGRRKTKDGWLCGLIGTALNCFWSLTCGGMILWSVMMEARAVSQMPAQPAAGPAPGWNAAPKPGAVNFTVTVPGRFEIQRSQTRVVVVTLNRAGGFQGNVTLSVDQEPAGLDVNPGVVVVPARVRAASFEITADEAAALGDKVISVRATDDFGGQTTVQIHVTVTAKGR